MMISYKLTEQDFIDFNVYHMNNSKTMKKTVLMQRLFGPLSFIIGIFVAYKITDIPLWYWSICFAIAAVLWFALYPKMLERRIRKQVKKMLSEGQNKILLSDTTLTVNEEGIKCTTEYNETNTKFSAINKVEITNKHIFVYNNAVSAIIIPLSAFETQNEVDKFHGFLRFDA